MRITVVVCLTSLAVLSFLPFSARIESLAQEHPSAAKGPRNSPEKGKVIAIPIDSSTEKPKSVVPFMHAKLAHSHRILEGLVTKDFEKISNAAESLMITSLRTPGIEPGETRNDEVFEHLKLEFLRLSGRLKEVADDRHLEGAAFVSEKLNATCISCHQYLRDELPRKPGVGRGSK